MQQRFFDNVSEPPLFHAAYIQAKLDDHQTGTTPKKMSEVGVVKGGIGFCVGRDLIGGWDSDVTEAAAASFNICEPGSRGWRRTPNGCCG